MLPRFFVPLVFPVLAFGCNAADSSTAVPEAQAHFEAGQEFLRRNLEAAEGDSAVARFTKAVELDDQYAQAWAGLARAHVWLGFNQGVEGSLPRAEEALEHAAELAPEAIETRVAAGYIAYRGFRDYDAALTEFLAAEEMGGDDPDIAGAVGNIYRRQGQLTEAIARYERRVELDSTHRRGFATLAQTYTSDGQYDGVMRAAQQLVSMDDRRGQYWRFWAHLHSGDTASAFAVVPDIKRAEGSEGQPGYFEVIRAVMRREDATLSALVDSIGLNVTGGVRREFLYYLWRTGQIPRGSEALDGWIANVEVQLAQERASMTMDVVVESSRRALLAFIEASRGNESAAMAHIERVLRLDPLVADAWSASGTLSDVNRAYLVMGRNDEALGILETLTERRLGPTVAWMEYHPSFDPIRDDSRFSAVMDARRAHERPVIE